MTEIVYKDYQTFFILDKEVNIISNETDYGINTIGEIDNQYYYLGNEEPNLTAAIFAYQDAFDLVLTEKELDQVFIDNGLE